MEAYEGVAVGGALVRSWLTGHPPLRAAWAASDWTGAGAGAGALAALCMGHSGCGGVSDCDENGDKGCTRHTGGVRTSLGRGCGATVRASLGVKSAQNQPMMCCCMCGGDEVLSQIVWQDVRSKEKC